MVGSIGDLNINQEKAFKTLLELDTIRGPHSTGVLFVGKDNETRVVKRTGTPWELYDHFQFKQAMTCKLKVLLGHNRWATQGGITNYNAHPFEFDTLIGAHNGTLKSCINLDDHTLFKVDSENIFYDMDTNGPKATIEKLNGAFALTWYDTTKDTFNIVRNSERPLYYTYTEDSKCMFYASEDWMLVVALAKHDIKHNKVHELAEMHWMEWKFDGVKINKPKITKLEEYKAPTPTYNTYGGQSWPYSTGSHYSRNTTYGTSTSAKKSLPPPKEEVVEDMEDKEELFATPEATFVSRQDWDWMARHGCAWCTERVRAEDAHKCLMMYDREIICPECASIEDVKQFIQ